MKYEWFNIMNSCHFWLIYFLKTKQKNLIGPKHLTMYIKKEIKPYLETRISDNSDLRL